MRIETTRKGMRGATSMLGAIRRRRFGVTVFIVGLFSWTFAVSQPCCEALAAAVPHGHPAEHHAPPAHPHAGDVSVAETAGGAHLHCAPHSLVAAHTAFTFAALEGPRWEDGGDEGHEATSVGAWLAAVAVDLAPLGEPPPEHSGISTYLRFQRFLE